MNVLNEIAHSFCSTPLGSQFSSRSDPWVVTHGYSHLSPLGMEIRPECLIQTQRDGASGSQVQVPPCTGGRFNDSTIQRFNDSTIQLRKCTLVSKITWL
jgi:hypothetical protein